MYLHYGNMQIFLECHWLFLSNVSFDEQTPIFGDHCFVGSFTVTLVWNTGETGEMYAPSHWKKPILTYAPP